MAARKTETLDPLGDDVTEQSTDDNASIVALQAETVRLREQLDAVTIERDVAIARAEAAEAKAAKTKKKTNPLDPHVFTRDFAIVVPRSGTHRFLAGQTVEDPTVLAMLHTANAPIAPK